MSDTTLPAGGSQSNGTTQIPTQTTTPAQSTTPTTATQAAFDLSEFGDQYKGKTPADIVKMHKEAEKRLGEHSKYESDFKKKEEQIELVIKALESDPKLYGSVQQLVRGFTQKGNTTQSTQNPDNAQPQDQKNAGADLRAREINRTFDEFRKSFKLDAIPTDKRSTIETKIATELAELLDPGGTKQLPEILNSVDLTRLPRALEKAFDLAHAGALRSNDDAFLQELGSIGSLSYSTPSNQDGARGLSDAEKETARKLGVSEEAYTKQLQSKKTKK